MRLSSAMVERTLDQFDARLIPDDHPVVPQLNRMFGEHTFFVDDDGLAIVEPVDPAGTGAEAGQVVKLAHWNDAGHTKLAPHDPQPTDLIVDLGDAREH